MVQEAREILPLDEETRQQVQRAIGVLAGRRKEIAERWADAYLASPVRPVNLSDDQVRTLIRRTLDVLVDNVGRGDFESYYRGLADVGQEYMSLGVSYSNVLLSTHLYESALYPILADAYPDQREMLDVFLALDHLNHNALAIVASAYFEASIEEVQERNRQLLVINSVATALSQTLELNRVLEVALDQVVRTLGIDYAEVFLIDEARQRLYPAAHRGISADFAKEIESVAIGEGLSGIVAETGKPLFIADLQRDRRFLRTLAREQHLRSGLGIPLIAKKRVVGVMNIYSHSPQPPQESYLRLLNIVGSEIGVAVENATLYHELEERAEQLVEAERRREQFISLVAHEFREPLTVIIGYGEMLGRAGPPDQATIGTTAETIVAQAKRLARLVDDLQDVSQIETGRFEVAMERFDLVNLAREVVHGQQATTERHKLVLRAPTKAVEVNWDRDRIAQALVNLLSNAIKYSPGGGKITLSVMPRNDEVEITVSDQGIGIAREDFPQLFQPYSQLYRRRRVKGTGLGLFITMGIVKAHRGSIWVESEVGKGTTFHMKLPREPEESPK